MYGSLYMLKVQRNAMIFLYWDISWNNNIEQSIHLKKNSGKVDKNAQTS